MATAQIEAQSTLHDLLLVQIERLRYELTNAQGNSWSKDPYTQDLVDSYLTALDQIKSDLENGTITPMEALSRLYQLISQCAFLVDNSLRDLRYSWSDSLAAAYDAAFAAYYTANHDSIRIDSLGHRADSLFGVAKDLADSALYIADSIGQELVKQTLRIDNVENLAKADSIRIDSIIGVIDDLTGRIDRDSVRINNLTGYVSYVDERGKRDSARIDALVLKYEDLFLKVEDIEKAYKEADEKLQAQIDTLKEDVAELQKNLDKVVAAMRTEITGIEIQATYNPIFGEFALPAGIQTNVLAAFYGQFDFDGKFPVGDGDDEDYWVGGVAKVSSSELPALKGAAFTPSKGIVVSGYDDDETLAYAGRVYLTVNPSNVDFTGKEFTLRKSNNDTVPVALAALERDNTELKWGYTRGLDVDFNGFYSAVATISKDDVENIALQHDFSGSKAALKQALQNWRDPSKINKTELANIVLRNMQQDISRLGVQAVWKDTLTGKNKAYVSKYDLAAVTAKPLGFDFLYGQDDIFTKYVEKIQNKFNNKVHYYESDLKSFLVFDLGLGSDPVSINIHFSASDNRLYVIANDRIPKQVNGGTGSATTAGVVTIDNVDVDYYEQGDTIAYVNLGEFLADLNNSVSSSTSGLNTFLDNVNGLQGRVDKKLGDISSKISAYVSTLLKWSDRAFAKANALLKAPNRYLRPAMFATTDADKVVLLSTESVLPTRVAAGTEIALFPTSYTGEIVAPALKKYVAVVNVEGGNATVESINNAVEQFNTVLDGDAYNQVKPIYFKTDDSMKGATIEIIYEALGYNGLVAGKKYFITVE